jgi:GxxExxY protein
MHRALGPGLLESAYRACLVHQLRLDGFNARTEVPIALTYEGLNIGAAYRADVVVDDTVLIELKAVDHIDPVHCVQLVTYLKLASIPIGLLINFNVRQLRYGIRRFLNPNLCREPSTP